MIVFETITEISTDVFDALYDQSSLDMDNGNYPWHLYPNITADQEKKNHILDAYTRKLSDGFVWLVSDDGHPLLLNAGIQTGSIAKWVLGLVGADINGSKSYLYSKAYRDARDAYWEELGITGWVLETVGESNTIDEHLKNRVKTNTLNANLSSATEDKKVISVLDLLVKKPE